MSPTRVLLMLLLLLAGCARQSGNEELMSQAKRFAAKGETKAAVIQLKNVLQQAPGDGPARLMLGQLYLDSGDVLSADKELRRALALGVNPGDAMSPLGKALLLQGQYQRLLDDIQADDQQPRLQALRGHALWGLKRFDEGRAMFERILLRHPEHPAALLGQARIALYERRRDEAYALVQRALAQAPGEVDALRLKGDVLRLQNKNADALLAYQQVLKLHPSLVQAHVDIASLHIQSGKLAEARRELSAARQVSPNSLMLIYTQALLEFREGKLGPAQDHLLLVLRAAPDHMPSNLLMGAVLRSKGLYTQAEMHLRKFLESNPGHPYASKLLASALVNTGSAEQALALVQPMFDSHREDLEMMSLAGEIHLRLQQYREAAKYFEIASKLAPRATMLRAALAMSHIGMGDNERAIAELEQATSLDGKSSRAGVLLVLSHLRGKQYDKALRAVQRMEARQAPNPMVQNLKGGVLLMNRDNVAARASFERALALDPLYLPALDNLTQLDLKDKKPEAARLRLEAALARDARNTDIMTALANLALTNGQPARVRGWLERAVRENPEDLAASMRLVNYYARNKELPKALVLAQKLHASNPTSPDVVALLATLQASSGNSDASLDNWNQLAVLQPDSPEIQLRIAQARLAARDEEGGMQALNKALALKPDYPQAQMALVRMLLAQRAYAKALQAARGFQQARAEAPLGYKLEGDVLMAQRQVQPALALYQKAYALQPSGALLIPLHGTLVMAGKAREAAERVRKWLDAHPGDQMMRQYFASSLMAAKDYPGSMAQFEQVLKQSPNQVIALNNMAWLCQQQKDPRALAFAERAYTLAPASSAVLDTLGWLLAEQGQLKRAVPLLKQAAALSPANTDIRYHYGAALDKSGDKRGAREQLEPLLAAKGFERSEAVKTLLAQ